MRIAIHLRSNYIIQSSFNDIYYYSRVRALLPEKLISFRYNK